jgi:hypothetical protein
MDETLLFLHVLSAFMLMATVVMLSSLALGAPVGARVASVGHLLWDVGATGTLVFGIWIVAREDAYDITDGWILAALALWFVMSGAGVRARQLVTEGDEPRYEPLGARLHWLRSVLVVAFLILMVWKPGA